MKLLSRFTLLFFTFIIILVSCDDDGGTNPPADNNDYSQYFQDDEGNYWIFLNTALDMQGKKDEGSSFEDSTAVVGQENYISKLASVYETFINLSGTSTGKNYFYFENPSIFANSSYIELDFTDIMSEDLELPLDIENKWVEVANFSKESWQVHTNNFSNNELTIEVESIEITGKLSGKYTITGSKGGKEAVDVDGSTIETQKIILTHKFTARFKGTAFLIVDFDIPVNAEFKVNYWYAEDIGLVKLLRGSEQLLFTDVPEVETYEVDVPGIQSDLMRYNVTASGN